MGDSKQSTAIPLKAEGKQASFVCDIESILIWRRICLIRYYQILGAFDNADVKWQDFDKKSSIITTQDENNVFERKLPHKELFKSVVEININKKKLFVINLYYTTKKFHIQGSKTSAWVETEYERLNKLLLEVRRDKGNNSKLDKLITDIEFPEMYEIEGDDLDKSETFPKNNEFFNEKNDDTVTVNQNKNNCTCQTELSEMKDTMHKIEQLIASKFEAESRFIEKSEAILKSLESLSGKIDKQNDSIEILTRKIDKPDEKNVSVIVRQDIEKIRGEIRDEIIKIRKEVTDIVKENVESETSDDEQSVSENVSKKVQEVGNTDVQHETRKEETNRPSTNLRRSSSGESIPPDFVHSQHEYDCFIIGTSIVKDLEARKMYAKKRIRIKTLNEKTIRGAKAFIRSGKVSASNIILQVASNDLDFDDDVDSVIAEMKDLVKQCRYSVPGCKIIVGDVLPRFYRNRSEKQNFEAKRYQFNDGLKTLADELDFDIIHHDNLTQVDFVDGIHLTREGGVPIFVKNIKDKLNPILGVENFEHKNRDSRNNYRNRQNSSREDGYRNGYSAYNRNDNREGESYNSYRPSPPYARNNQQDVGNVNPFHNRNKGMNNRYFPQRLENRNNGRFSDGYQHNNVTNSLLYELLSRLH